MSAASPEVGCTAESYLHRSREPIGLARSRHDLAVSSGPGQYPLDAIPRFLAKSGSSSRALVPSSEFVTARARPYHPCGCVRAPSLRFLSPSRHRCLESTSRRGFQSSPMFRPQRFSHSRRFAPRCTLWACFIPLPRPGFTVQGVSPLPSQHKLVAMPSPLVVADFRLQPGCPNCPAPAASPPGS